jgi:hypothetical protein
MLVVMAAGVQQQDAPRRPQDGPRPSQGTPQGRSQTIVAACAISAAAGVIHAVAMVDHFDHHWSYGVFFLLVTYFQVMWAVSVYRRPGDRRALTAGVIASIAISSVWLVSRTVGVPIGPEAGDPERVGAMDLVATLDQLVLAGLLVAILWPAAWLGQRLAWISGATAVRLGVMLCSASLFATLLGSHAHH